MAAHPAAPGWGLKTTEFPAAIMLMAFPVRVGTLCVEGVMAPITPHGAKSMTVRPKSPLKAIRSNISTPGTSSEQIFSFSILWSRRPIFVSLNSIVPHSSALATHILRMMEIAFFRAETPSALSWSYERLAASIASSIFS